MNDPRHATMDDVAAVAALLERCAAADGRAALSEFKALRVPVANGVRSLVVAGDDDRLIALGVAAWHSTEIGEEGGYWAAEIAVDPDERSTANYVWLAQTLQSDVGEPLALWTFDPLQAEAAQALGLREVRAILEMRRALPAANGHFPEGVSIRPFVRDVDETAWLVLNQKVFAQHPEAGSIDSADFALRMAQSWFDPAGLLILCDRSDPIGYAWTKQHPNAVGEIYMIGLIPAYRGRGLARPLTLVALDQLARAGATTAMLYAEASNESAIGLYTSMGFGSIRRIALFDRPVEDRED